MQAYLWPNLQLNTKSNPLFKHIQIDLYDPLRIQHESLPYYKHASDRKTQCHTAGVFLPVPTKHSIQKEL
eukprot:jgi/Chrzof1/2096/Cz11g02180.t1